MTPSLQELYETLAEGGIGLIITGVAYINKECSNSKGRMGIYDDSFVQEYRNLTSAIHSRNCPIVIQLAYAGQNGETVAPGSLSKEKLHTIIQQFGHSARRAKESGFDGVQIHAAHGFFLSQFLNPQKNHRQDEYGGNLENRTRFIIEIYEEIRRQTGEDFTIFIKIDGTDKTLSDSLSTSTIHACDELARRGINAIEISGENAVITPQNPLYPESPYRDFAKSIAEKVDIPIILVGVNRTVSTMEHILNTSKIQYFALSRPLIRQPDLVNSWRKNPEEVPACISCNRCFNPNGSNTCVFNR